MHADVLFLSLLVFLPALGALVLAFIPKGKPEVLKLISLAVTAATFALSLWMIVPSEHGATGKFLPGQAQLQNAFSVDWIPSFNIFYFMGMDGISFTLRNKAEQ